MADKDKPYTYEDLEQAVADFSYAKGELKGWEDKRNSARSAMDSHQKEVDKAVHEVDRRKALVQRILTNLEK